MAIITIPLRNDIFNYSFSKELNDITYLFIIRYDAREDTWTMDIGTDLQNAPLLGGQDILGQFHHLPVPEGELRMVDLDGLNEDATRTNIGDRVVMQYTEA